MRSSSSLFHKRLEAARRQSLRAHALLCTVKVRSSDDMMICDTVSLAAFVCLTVAARAKSRAADNAASEQFTTQYGRP